MPRAGIRELWKTIAPVMLPRAKVSLPLLSQMMLLNFSGSSVATGAIITDRMKAESPRVTVIDSRAITKLWAPRMIRARATSTCATRGGSGGCFDLGAKKQASMLCSSCPSWPSSPVAVLYA